MCLICPPASDSLSSAAEHIQPDNPSALYDYDDEGVWTLTRDYRGAAADFRCVDISLSLSSTPRKEVPAEASAAMGRQEADYVWKKTTENIQEIFEFIEELGS